MSSIWISIVRFVRGAWYVLGLAAGILWDPVDWTVQLGLLKPGTSFFPNDETRVASFLLVTIIAVLVWYHRQRVTFDGEAAAGDIDLPSVIQRLSERSRWALKQPHRTDNWPALVREELLTRLSRDVRIRAAGHFRQSTAHPADDGQRWIDADFWRDVQALHVWDILIMPESRNWAANPRRGEWYERIVLSRATVERVWPDSTMLERAWRRLRHGGASTADIAKAERLHALRVAKLTGADLDREQRSAYRQMFGMHD